MPVRSWSPRSHLVNPFTADPLAATLFVIMMASAVAAAAITSYLAWDHFDSLKR